MTHYGRTTSTVDATVLLWTHFRLYTAAENLAGPTNTNLRNRMDWPNYEMQGGKVMILTTS